MALTLLQSNIYRSGTIHERTVVETYARESEILRVLPFKSISGNAYEYNQVDKLPGVEFRRVNEPFNESTGTVKPTTERLKIAGGRLDVDKFLVDTNGQDERSLQEYLKQVALVHYWSDKFFNGNETVNEKEFTGLKNRITGDQLITPGTTAGGDPVKMADIDRLIRQVKNPTHLVMNAKMRDYITQGTRKAAVGGNVTYTIDDFGRSVTTFGGLPILIMGQNNLDVDIIPFNEANPKATNDVAGTSTSIYCLSIRAGGVMGLQNGEIQVIDQGLVHPWYRTVIEWYTTIMIQDVKSAARLAGIKDADMANS